MASEIGIIPANGGEYLQFLIAVRQIVECDASIDARLSGLQTELLKQRWAEISKHEGHSFSALSGYFFPEFLDCIPRLREESRAELRALGMRSVHDILAASFQQVSQVPGIRKRTYETMTAFAQAVRDRCEGHRLECVNR
ncbi:hypothetical protein ASD58_21205 [Duganella sp. Root1480D1]|nr:hypothetical protein ASD58_21205 [Duganella sp. Root1480D1]